MSRTIVPILAYHEATRRAYVFPGQTEAARWLLAKGLCSGKLNTVRSNLCLVSTWPRPDSGISKRALHGFIWVRADGPDCPVALLMEKLIRRKVAGIVDPAHEPSAAAPLASGIRLMDGIPD